MFKSITGTGIKAKKVVAATTACCLAVSALPQASLAVHDAETAQDNTYTGKAAVFTDDEESWSNYSLDLELTVKDGVIESLNYGSVGSENASYVKRAIKGTSKVKGLEEMLKGQPATYQTVETLDAVSGATCTASAVKEALKSMMAEAPKAEEEDEYTYVYAELTYDEYYAAEPVQNGDSAESSDETDTRGEYDKGAFDAVTRATTNHGLHRGSFQSAVVIYDTEGNVYEAAGWDGKNTIILTDGTTVGFDRGTITIGEETKTMAGYEVTGFKYIPVAVKTSDYEEFKNQYKVVENGETLFGGFSEVNLSAYSETAEVTADTNGLKEAVKNSDGTFSFGERQTGTDSGIKDSELKTADISTLGVEVKDSSSYGDFIRVDLTGNYGDLGANMQSVIWKYYGENDTTGTPLAVYGTKFAADNWMHKSMGIQLGLTESKRCTLPEGYDGSGNWTVTICALGYADTVIPVNVAESDIHMAHAVSSTEALEAAIGKAESLVETDYTAGWDDMQAELAEARDELEKAGQTGKTTQENVDEATEHLNMAIDALQADYVYGTMNIPYAKFYEAEAGSEKAEQIDAVTSATDKKWKTFDGTYYEADTAEGAVGGKILGVTFPVAVLKSVSETLTEADGFTMTEGTAPAVYKILNADGSYSALQRTEEMLEGVTYTLNADSKWGDIQIDADGLDLSNAGTVYGVLVTTVNKSGEESVYGMRHLENIWKKIGELAWSVGDRTTEVKGNLLSYRAYQDMQGQTITKVTYICANGIYSVDTTAQETALAVPYKAALNVEVSSGASGDGSVSLSFTEKDGTTKTSLPDDFDAVYIIRNAAGDEVANTSARAASEFTVSGNVITYKNAYAGAYTLVIRDASGKYADKTVTFTLITDQNVAVIRKDHTGLEAAKDVTAEEFANYISNISAVTVKSGDTEKTYKTSGKGALTLIKEDGSLDLAAESRGETVFAQNGIYTITVAANGFNNDVVYDITIKDGKIEADETPDVPENPDPEKPSEEKPSTENPSADKETEKKNDVVNAEETTAAEKKEEVQSTEKKNDVQIAETTAKNTEETTAAGENKTADGNVKTGDFANPWVFAFGMVTALMTGSAVFSAKARKKVQKKTGKK